MAIDHGRKISRIPWSNKKADERSDRRGNFVAISVDTRLSDSRHSSLSVRKLSVFLGWVSNPVQGTRPTPRYPTLPLLRVMERVRRSVHPRKRKPPVVRLQQRGEGYRPVVSLLYELDRSIYRYIYRIVWSLSTGRAHDNSHAPTAHSTTGTRHRTPREASNHSGN